MKGEIGPAPPGCHYRRCWCMWWIVPDKEKRRLVCNVCGVDKLRTDARDFAAVGLILKEDFSSTEPTMPLDRPSVRRNDTDLWGKNET